MYIVPLLSDYSASSVDWVYEIHGGCSTEACTVHSGAGESEIASIRARVCTIHTC